MSYLLLTVISCFLLLGVTFYWLVKRSSQRLSPSSYWSNRNRTSEELLKLRERIQNEDIDFKHVKQLISVTIKYRNLLKRMSLETESIQLLAAKLSRIAHSEFEEIRQLRHEMQKLKETLPGAHAFPGEPTIAGILSQLYQNMEQTETCLSEWVSDEKFITLLPDQVGLQLQKLRENYDNTVRIHTLLIEYYHDVFASPSM